MASLRSRTTPLRALRSIQPLTRPSPLKPTLSTRPNIQPATPTPIRKHSTSSVSADELSHFSALASSWWDPMGPSRILHLMNPLRHEFIASCLAEGSTETTPSPSTPNSAIFNYLDVGCGGGIFARIPRPHDPTRPKHRRANTHARRFNDSH